MIEVQICWSVEVPFMQSREDQLTARHDGFKVLKLRYRTASDSDDEGVNFFWLNGAAVGRSTA